MKPLPLDNAWKHIFFTYDGSGRASGVKIYVNGVQVATRVLKDNLGRCDHSHWTLPMQLGWRNPDEHPAKDARYQDIRLYARALAPDEVKPASVRGLRSGNCNPTACAMDSRPIARRLPSTYLNNVDATWRQIQREIAPLDEQLDRLSAGGNLTLVSWEKSTLPYAHVLTRGVYTARTERVEANTPHFLPPLPPNEPHNRLALAKWTISPENPLTARVTVNRMWYELFGTGLVETTEDFGIMGQRPTHPELLDWLARRIPGQRMEHQAHVQADGDVGDVPAKLESKSAATGKRSQKSCACLAARGSAWMPRWFATSRCSRADCWYRESADRASSPISRPTSGSK